MRHAAIGHRLEKMLRLLGGKGELRRLFNTSGGDYRTLDLKSKLPSMSEAEALALVAGNGNLIKRPFLLLAGTITLGFDAGEWAGMLLG